MLVLIAVYFEAMIFVILNASVVGVLFARISVANRRASQIIFSDKAAIRCVRNRFYFMFQVGEASFLFHLPSYFILLLTSSHFLLITSHFLLHVPGGRGLLLRVPPDR